MTLSPELRAWHERLSPYARKFLEFVTAEPSRQRRIEFWHDDLPDWVLEYPYQLQSWPTFLSGDKLREVSEVSGGICRLIKSIPERIFAGDAERIGSYYGIPPAMVQEMLAGPSGSERALGRGDYIDTEVGLQCLEMNLSAQIGGWQLRYWADSYLRSGYLTEFLEQEKIDLFYRDPFHALLDHIVEHAAASPGIGDGELNLALIFSPEDWGPNSPAMLVASDREYREILTAHGREGRFLSGGFEILQGRDGAVFSDGRKIQVILEYSDSLPPSFVLESHRRGQIHLYNGPMSRIWDDKRNLALLSENQDSGLFTSDEERFLQVHLPWTRLLAPDFTDFRGERVFLPDLILARRKSLVLKQALAARGEAVYIGLATPEEKWRKVLDAALSQGAWVVQEHVTSGPYLFQHGDSGAMLHDVVWGLFTFGDRFGGGFLRMMPSGRHGIVNAAQGATVGMFFEAVERDR